MPELRYLSLRAETLQPHLEELGRLRIEVFRDFPYLYEGSLEYETNYLKKYLHSSQALAFMVYDGDRAVGATTCLPLRDEEPEVQKPFLDKGYKVEDYFYFGESILLKPYRGLGIGKRFFEEREVHAQQFGTYTHTCFCAVERPGDHPLTPSDYHSNRAFWAKTGYTEYPSLYCEMRWQDIDQQEETAKKLVFWLKPIGQ